ncbi:hypothetical protein ACWIGI_28635 [Nocardia sp. NPDC055321]
MSTDSVAWLGLAGALGGVTLTAAAGIVVAILNHRWQAEHATRQFHQEQVKLLRTERREAYARFWAIWTRLNHQLVLLRNEVNEHGSIQTPELSALAADREWPDTDLEWREAVDVLRLISGEKVLQAADEFMSAVDDKAAAARRGERFATTPAYHRLSTLMREELLP